MNHLSHPLARQPCILPGGTPTAEKISGLSLLSRRVPEIAQGLLFSERSDRLVCLFTCLALHEGYLLRSLRCFSGRKLHGGLRLRLPPGLASGDDRLALRLPLKNHWIVWRRPLCSPKHRLLGF